MRDSTERDLAVADELGRMADARIKELESKLAQVEQERESYRQDLLRQTEVVTRLLEQSRLFRTRAVTLCRDKAAEWDRVAMEDNTQLEALTMMAMAARELAAELEKL